MRKTFNFYRSYWDVANELNDKDRLAFYDALMKRQFTGIETDLDGMVKFAYLSQKHSIDRQIEGYENKTKQPLHDPTVGGGQGGSVAPSVQLKEKEKEKEKEKIISIEERKINFAYSLKPFLDEYGKDMLNEFYGYWTEPTQTKNPKLKFELEKTWDVSRRLANWKKQGEKFNPKQPEEKKFKFAWQ